MTWRQTEWRTWKTYLGKNKEVFNTELYAIGETLSIDRKRGQTGRGRTSQ